MKKVRTYSRAAVTVRAPKTRPARSRAGATLVGCCVPIKPIGAHSNASAARQVEWRSTRRAVSIEGPRAGAATSSTIHTLAGGRIPIQAVGAGHNARGTGKIVWRQTRGALNDAASSTRPASRAARSTLTCCIAVQTRLTLRDTCGRDRVEEVRRQAGKTGGRGNAGTAGGIAGLTAA